MRLPLGVAGLSAVVAASAPVGVTADHSGASARSAPAPHQYGCPILPPANAPNRDISRAPVDRHSADYIASIGLYEVMTVSKEIQAKALERRSAEQLRDIAVREGMRRLREDGLEKARQGLTSVAEVLRVVGSS